MARSTGLAVGVGLMMLFGLAGICTLSESENSSARSNGPTPGPSPAAPEATPGTPSAAPAADTNAPRAADPAKLAAALTSIRNAKASKNLTVDEVTVKVVATKSGSKWIYDRNNVEYSYSEADKDSQYHWLDVDISSESKDPQLPAFFACSFSNRGEFESCKPLAFHFRRWDDYGSYLGNYADSGNDFAKHDTVKFTTGFMATKKDLKNPTLIVAISGCQIRNVKRFGRPKVEYVSTCLPPVLDGEVGLEYLASLPVVEILNKKQLAESLDARLATLPQSPNGE